MGSLLNIQNSIIPQVQGQLYAISQTVQTKTAILANISSIPANILGLITISCVMYGICSLISLKKGALLNEE